MSELKALLYSIFFVHFISFIVLEQLFEDRLRPGGSRIVSESKTVNVVATTRRNGTRDILTSAKLSVGYLVVGITRELDKEPSLYCSSIYTTILWSVLQQCVYLMSIHYASTSCPLLIHMCFP